MKKQQTAKSNPRPTLREQYRQLGIKILKKERSRITDIQSLRELIEVELGRSVKTDELITAFERRDDGLEVVTREETTWVIYKAPAIPKKVKMSPPKTKMDPKKKSNSIIPITGKKKLTPTEFILKAIRDLRSPGYRGIHTVFSGFNEAFRAHFPGLDPVKTTKRLFKAGVITLKHVRGGAYITISSEKKVEKKKTSSQQNMAEETLKKMGLA